MRKNKLSENDEKDIVRAVIGAKDPIMQCRIEAELRAMDVRDMENILLRHGIDVRRSEKPVGGRPHRVTDDTIIHLAKSGYSAEQVAEKTGYNVKTIYARLRAIKRKEMFLESEGLA